MVQVYLGTYEAQYIEHSAPYNSSILNNNNSNI